MNKSVVSVILVSLLVLLVVSKDGKVEVRPVTLKQRLQSYASVGDLIKEIADQQQQLNRKLIKHYLEAVQVQNFSEDIERVKKIINNMFKDQQIKQLQSKLGQFMRERLKEQLEINTLAPVFIDEINQNPSDYFLTEEMYDLLID